MNDPAKTPHETIHDMCWGCILSRAIHVAAGLALPM